jgi:ketosteroid isomerase-like protein
VIKSGPTITIGDKSDYSTSAWAPMTTKEIAMTHISDPTSMAKVRELIGRCHEALTEQSRGRPEPLLELWSRADDVSIMAAIGGYHVGFDAVSGLLSAASKTQSFDSWSADNLVTDVANDLAFSVELEHYGRLVDGEDQGMTLRATQIYRREDGQWRIVHRHGDILAPIEAKW